MEFKLHQIKVKRSLERKRMQELLIKITLSIALSFTLIFTSVSVFQTVNKKYQTITVKKGDTLWNIADRINNGKDVRGLVSEISSVNGIQPNNVMSGQQIMVPVF